MKSICIIPARGGSKRIPRKNIKLFRGTPLIGWVIEIAKQSDCFDEIFISTDDLEIANYSKALGAKIPFLRPEKLSDDYTSTMDVMKYMVQQLKEFDGKKLTSITKEGLDLGDNVAELQKEYQKVCDTVKQTLDNKVTKVVVSTRLENSPCCLVTGEHGWSANMERIMKAQALGGNQMQMYMMSQKTLELNPQHRIVKKLKERVEGDSSDGTIKDLVWLLYETSMIASGFTLDQPNVFAGRIHRLVELGMGCDDEEEEEDEELPELEADDNSQEDQMEQVD